eukprot:CAMPEP_0181188586 /NCGR_PEP_ID=MMETSP1096-20121128/11201_1 /TAXON_ID=156174 ORGANISM="Chrysochromulina ericina, Strain CCMP281" /NCGR_SAMPLE_ID=MMETSP1096 /ASSEMBLY_ACC=CAM_ASM_000453 /LENGTH=60 /DNA_ID=CAMNT_0023277669 /DNA_START=485 /DNA_END=664 /DNA_ORIENTATION=-
MLQARYEVEGKGRLTCAPAIMRAAQPAHEGIRGVDTLDGTVESSCGKGGDELSKARAGIS